MAKKETEKKKRGRKPSVNKAEEKIATNEATVIIEEAEEPIEDEVSEDIEETEETTIEEEAVEVAEENIIEEALEAQEQPTVDVSNEVVDNVKEEEKEVKEEPKNEENKTYSNGVDKMFGYLWNGQEIDW